MNASVLSPASLPAPVPAGGAAGSAAGGAPAGEGTPPGAFAKALDRAARPASERPPTERAARQDAASPGKGAAAGGAGEVTESDATGDPGAGALPPPDADTLPAAEPPPGADAAWLAALLPGTARSLPAPEAPRGGAPGSPVDAPPAAGRPGGRGPGTAGRLPGDPAVTDRLPREPGAALPDVEGRETLPAAVPPLADARPDGIPPGGPKAKPAQPAPGARTPLPEAAPPLATLPQPPVGAAPPLQAEPMPLPLAPVLGPPQWASLPAAHAAAGGDAATTSPAEARLALAPGQAGFAPALGATLATFVRQGIEHARLHLNPAEMGPVAVQIRLDGQAAQVLMSAAHADTRAALEQALPTLAGALREAGLTLAGGGVFEQPRDTRRDDGSGEGRGAPRDGLAAGALREAAPAASAAPVQRRGVVDLVA